VVPPLGGRARDGAPRSTPLKWSECEELAGKRSKDPGLEFGKSTITNTAARLKREGDLWSGKFWKEAALEQALQKARTRWES